MDNNIIIISRDEVKQLMNLAMLAGRILLDNGAEVYRVEDTMNRICDSKENIKEVDSFVTQTGIFLTVKYEDEVFTYLKRIKNPTIDLNKIKLVNDFSRNFVNNNISIDQGLDILNTINSKPGYPKYVRLLAGSYVSGFFSLMFGGSGADFFASIFASFISLLILDKISIFNLTFFIDAFIGAFFVSLFGYISINLGIGDNIDMIIIGGIMYLVPGVSITNSIRDTMSGDSLSGLSKGAQSVFTALAIAFGVGIVLNFKAKGWI